MLAGASAALVAAAAAVTAAHGAGFQKPGPLPWRDGPRPAPVPGDDAELLALAAGFFAADRDLNSLQGEEWETKAGALHARWYAALERITDLTPQTAAGKHAKAAVGHRALESTEPEQREERAALSALRDVLGGAPEPLGEQYSADADLVALCERLVAWEAKYDAIYLTIVDDDEADAAAAPMMPEYDDIKRQLYALGAPRTIAGQRAFARAALASAQRSSDGSVILDDGGSLGSYLAFGLAHSMAAEALS